MKPLRQSGDNTPPAAIFCLVTSHPWKSFSVVFFVHLLFLLITVTSVLGGYDIFPVDLTSVPSRIYDHPYFGRAESYLLRRSDREIQWLNTNREKNVIDQNWVDWFSLTIFYSTKGDHVLTESNIKAVKEFESNLTNLPMFAQFYEAPKSVFPHISRASDMHAIIKFIGNKVLHLVDKDYHSNLSTKTFSTKSIRTVIMPKLVGQDFNSESFQNFRYNVLRPFLKASTVSSIDTLSIVFWNSDMYAKEIRHQALSDSYFAFAALGFLILFMGIHSHSLLLTCSVVFGEFAAFLATNFIYRVVLNYRYFGLFHLLSIFIILGIGADDFFVFLDTWRASGTESYPSIAHRMAACYRRAAKAMLVTSVTTATAFFVNALSPISLFSTFGIFMGLLVLLNYISVITLFPCTVLLYEKLCHRTRAFACPTQAKKRSNLMVIFFEGPFYRAISSRIISICSIAICGALVLYFAVMVTRISPSSTAVHTFNEHHNFRRARAMESRFENGATIQVALMWGIKPRNKVLCHKTDFHCRGYSQWDNDFNLNDWSAQIALHKICNTLRYNTTLHKALRIKTSADGVGEVDCFIDRMQQYFHSHESRHNASMCRPQTFVVPQMRLPISQIKFKRLLTCENALYNSSAFETQIEESFQNFFESGLQYYLLKGDTGISVNHKSMGMVYTDALSQPDVRRRFPLNASFYGGKLKYIVFFVNTTLNTHKDNFITGLPVADLWEQFVHREVSKMPHSLRRGVQFTPEPLATNGFVNMWECFAIQKAVYDNAVYGIILGFVISFPLLLITLENIVLSCFAILSIFCTAVSVAGMLPMLGWSLGVVESINLSLVVGLSFDYVVHLAEGYFCALRSNRFYSRRALVRDMLRTVGISVTSGAATTLGAASFLFFVNLVFFQQFGVFTFCTLGFSFFYALFLFTPLLLFFGPVDNSADYRRVVGRLWSLIAALGTRSEKSTIAISDCQTRSSIVYSEKHGSLKEDTVTEASQPHSMFGAFDVRSSASTSLRESFV